MTGRKLLKRQKLRNNEYYDMQSVFDELYENSLAKCEFKNLISIITAEENIRLAYRNLKKNAGSRTPGTDGKTIADLAKMSEPELIGFVQQKFNWYQPQSVRRMWRVLANVFNNAAKYAMEGSRVYVDLVQTGEEVRLTIKNVSEQPLNISADELTERFIRGDVSRSTEGSGLGLSIAQNLTKLQGGEFELYLDGDLFKVLIRFPIPKETEDVYQEVEQ